MVKRRRIVVIRRIANITYTIMARGEVGDIFLSPELYCIPGEENRSILLHPPVLTALRIQFSLY
jgi:hypothetical protein